MTKQREPLAGTPAPGALRAVHDRLLAHYGRQHWWPAEGRFEVMVGAVLTQNTAWTNVEKAIAALVEAGALDPAAIVALEPAELGALLRPVGYFNVKARRLQNFCRWYLEQFDGAVGDPFAARPTETLRRQLLTVNGVGPETADDILLYALERPVFVIDAYTRRLFGRLGLLDGQAGYEALRAAFEHALAPDVALFNEYHALVVIHAKHHCRRRPLCDGCPLSADCPASHERLSTRQCSWTTDCSPSRKSSRP